MKWVARRKCSLFRFLLNINRGQCLKKHKTLYICYWKRISVNGSICSWAKKNGNRFETLGDKNILSTSQPHPNCNVQNGGGAFGAP